MGDQAVKSIDVKMLQEMLSERSVQVLDVRRAEDEARDPVRISGARWCDPTDVAGWVPDLPDGPVVVYCVRGGSVSKSVAEALAGAGRDVVMVEGGLAAWRDAGGEVE